MSENNLVLYSFRRCPYAMRARLALALSETSYEHREILLKDKPQHLLEISPKGQVPVFFGENLFLEESLDIILWALKRSDPNTCLPQDKATLEEHLSLIHKNDNDFKKHLDICKYSTRFTEEEFQEAKEVCHFYLSNYEQVLSKQNYLSGETLGLLDLAIFPFLRQFSKIKPEILQKEETPKLKQWLDTLETSQLFESIMEKYEPWKP